MGSSNTGSFSWLSLATLKVSVYLHGYAGSLDARRFAAMPALGDRRIVYDARYGVCRKYASSHVDQTMGI